MPTDNGSLAFYNWFVYEFWRFVFVQQEVAKYGANIHRVSADAEGRQLQPGSVKEQIQKAILANAE